MNARGRFGLVIPEINSSLDYEFIEGAFAEAKILRYNSMESLQRKRSGLFICNIAFVFWRRIYMGLSWLKNDFICKELYAPYIIDRDSDYYDSLHDKYNIVLKQAKKAGADAESIAIIKRYSRKILESIRAYYNADLSKSSTIIRNLIQDLGDNPFAIDDLSSSDAFFGSKMRNYNFLGAELVYFRRILKLKICYIFLKV